MPIVRNQADGQPEISRIQVPGNPQQGRSRKRGKEFSHPEPRAAINAALCRARAPQAGETSPQQSGAEPAKSTRGPGEDHQDAIGVAMHAGKRSNLHKETTKQTKEDNQPARRALYEVCKALKIYTV